jgi:hypothetical protein
VLFPTHLGHERLCPHLGDILGLNWKVPTWNPGTIYSARRYLNSLFVCRYFFVEGNLEACEKVAIVQVGPRGAVRLINLRSPQEVYHIVAAMINSQTQPLKTAIEFSYVLESNVIGLFSSEDEEKIGRVGETAWRAMEFIANRTIATGTRPARLKSQNKSSNLR